MGDQRRAGRAAFERTLGTPTGRKEGRRLVSQPKARAAPTDPGAPPPQLGSLRRPRQLASCQSDYEVFLSLSAQPGKLTAPRRFEFERSTAVRLKAVGWKQKEVDLMLINPPPEAQSEP